MRKKILFTSLIILSFGFFMIPGVTRAQNISKTQKAGKVSVTLKVLPAEHFKGSDVEMKWDGGAKPDYIQGSSMPNYHLVTFVKKKGKPVEDASVTISYRELSPNKTDWMSLPVARMHVAGKSLKTTHYGNNAKLADGNYEARVTVNDNPPATFRFSLNK